MISYFGSRLTLYTALYFSLTPIVEKSDVLQQAWVEREKKGLLRLRRKRGITFRLVELRNSRNARNSETPESKTIFQNLWLPERGRALTLFLSLRLPRLSSGNLLPTPSRYCLIRQEKPDCSQ